jgi:hypothetical protein
MTQMKLILRSKLIKEAECKNINVEDLFSRMAREDPGYFIINDVWKSNKNQ